MQFSVTAGQLALALKPVTSIINNRSLIPVLQCVKISADKNTLTLMGTDLESQILLTLPDIAVAEAGVALIDAAKFRSVVSALPATAEIHCKIQPPDAENFNLRKMELKWGRSRYQFDSLSLDDYPEFNPPPADEQPVTLMLTKTELLGMIAEVSAAMAKQDVRYYLNGILFESKENMLSLVATDGHRMSASQMLSPTTEPFAAIVAGDTIKALQSLPLQDNFNLSFYPSRIALDSDRLQFSAKLIEGNYPDWRRVLPDESTYTPVVVDAKTLIGAVARLSVVASQNAKGLKTPLRLSIIKMNDAVDELELAVGEEGREMLELAEFKDAIDFEIGLNIDYLEDALKPVDTEKLTLGLRDQNSSLVVRYKEDQVSILMPLRI